MKKYLFLLGGLTLLATPANAITWKEFWEPFDGNQTHHYHGFDGYKRNYRPRHPRRPNVCHRHFHFHQRSGIIHEDRHCHGNGHSHHGEDERHPVYTTPGKYYF